MRSAHGTAHRSARGFSLIEVMVALVISSVVVIGLVSLINAIGVANRTQDGLARLQENGRFAMQRIASDLRLAGSQHCSKDNTFASMLAAGGSSYVDGPRMTRTYFDAAAVASNGPGIGPASAAPWYEISPRFMLMGHECTNAVCTPGLAVANRGVNRLGAAIPDMGTAAGSRGQGADVVTLRYFSTPGALVNRVLDAQPGPPDAQVELANDAAALLREGFTTMAANDPVWVSDCSAAMMLRGTMAGQNIVMSGNFDNGGMMQILSGAAAGGAGAGTRSDIRAFHLPTSLRTVSYYLQLKNDPKLAGRVISGLMRKVDADPAQELVEGVERFDLLYGVMNSAGNTRFLTAQQVDALAAGGECVGMVEPGCGWRAVRSVEVYLLVNTVDDVSPVGNDEFRYSWLNTGAANNAGAFENPQTLGTLRNGLPPGRMLRREFRATVGLRSSNF
ncbi:MAG: PilW family protein [Pseudomonadota bacterium]|jgi:type IV pilus assembly protein PilW